MDELIKQVANYIVNNRATINEMAGAFGKSVSSIKKYINDADKLQRIDFELYLKVKEVQKVIELNGQIAGGRIGKRSAGISDYDSIEMAQDRIDNYATLEQLSKKYNVPTSTIYEAIKRIDDDETQRLLSEVSLANQTYFKTNESVLNDARKR